MSQEAEVPLSKVKAARRKRMERKRKKLGLLEQGRRETKAKEDHPTEPGVRLSPPFRTIVLHPGTKFRIP